MGQRTTNREAKPYDRDDYFFNNQLPFGIAVRMGKIDGIEGNNKFGQIKSLDIADGRLPVNEMKESYPYQTSAFQPFVASTSINDTLLGTGAQKVTVIGNDENGDIQEEEIELNGQTPVQSTLQWSDIYRMFTSQVGSGETTEGLVYCGLGTFTAGVPVTKLALIDDGNNQTQMCQVTVPRGYVMLITSITYTVVSGKPMIFQDEIKQRDSVFDNTKPFRNVRTIQVTTDYSLQLNPPAIVNEFSTARITALATQNGSNGECAFRYYLVRKDWFERRYYS